MRGGRRLNADTQADYERFVQLEEEILTELMGAGYTQKEALAVVGLSRSGWHYRHHPRPKKTAGQKPVPPKKLTDGEHERIREVIAAGHEAGLSVSRIFFDHVDSDGDLLGSLRTFYRIYHEVFDPQPTPEKARKPRGIPQVAATRPGQVLCWDITWLPAGFMTKGYNLYTVLDLYSRKIMGHTIQYQQRQSVANTLIHSVISQAGLDGHDVEILHTDNGGIMTSNSMRTMLNEDGVELSLIRPNTSNDNAYEESSHRTIKHHRYAKEVYPTIDDAIDTIGKIIDEYNNFDRHSGLNGYTPEEVYTGQWEEILTKRQAKEKAYYQKHPTRKPKTSMFKAPPQVVGINIGKITTLEELEQLELATTENQ